MRVEEEGDETVESIEGDANANPIGVGKGGKREEGRGPIRSNQCGGQIEAQKSGESQGEEGENLIVGEAGDGEGDVRIVVSGGEGGEEGGGDRSGWTGGRSGGRRRISEKRGSIVNEIQKPHGNPACGNKTCCDDEIIINTVDGNHSTSASAEDRERRSVEGNSGGGWCWMKGQESETGRERETVSDSK